MTGKNRTRVFFFLWCGVLSVIPALYAPVCAFDWPQQVEGQQSFLGFFGQPRGNALSVSVVFSGSHPVAAAESGTVIASLSSSSGDMGWFDSPLGNAVIIAHAGGIQTVYANLQSVVPGTGGTSVPEKSEIGVSGGSGWHVKDGGLEFQTADLQNAAAINPLVLMPRSVQYEKPKLLGIRLVNKRNTAVNLSERRTVPAGVYTVFIRTAAVIPFKTQVSVNGAIVETVSYDMLTLTDGKLAAAGSIPLSYDVMYKNGMQYIAEVTLKRGRTALAVVLTDINGVETQSSVNLSVE